MSRKAQKFAKSVEMIMMEDEKARRYLRTMGAPEAPDAKRQRMERCPTDSWSSTTSYSMCLSARREMPQAGAIIIEAPPPCLLRQRELDRRQHQLLQQQLLQQQQELQHQQPHNPNVQ